MRRICRVMVEPLCSFHSQTWATKASRPRSWRLLPGFLELALDDDLRRDAGMVGARHPQRVVAAHAVVARQRVHDGVLERVPHVQRAGHVRRRQLDRERRLARDRASARRRRSVPTAAPSGPRWRRVRRTWRVRSWGGDAGSASCRRLHQQVLAGIVAAEDHVVDLADVGQAACRRRRRSSSARPRASRAACRPSVPLIGSRMRLPSTCLYSPLLKSEAEP